MPCFTKKEESLTVKLVSLFPQQSPSLHSIIILFNSTTGAIEAVRNDYVYNILVRVHVLCNLISRA